MEESFVSSIRRAQRFISLHGHLLMETFEVFKTICTNAIIILFNVQTKLLNCPDKSSKRSWNIFIFCTHMVS